LSTFTLEKIMQLPNYRRLVWIAFRIFCWNWPGVSVLIEFHSSYLVAAVSSLELL